MLPAEPDGIEPEVAPVAAAGDGEVVDELVDEPDVELVDLSLIILVLTSQHLFGSGVVVLVCAPAKPTPAIIAAAAKRAIFFMEVSRYVVPALLPTTANSELFDEVPRVTKRVSCSTQQARTTG